MKILLHTKYFTFVFMLNIGLIGKIDSLELQIRELKNYEEVVVKGKSSVGTKDIPSDYSFTIPEYNRIELLERSDALILDDHSLLPYELIKDSIKRNKHIFFADYPVFTHDQFKELIKLIDESGTIIQIKNPFAFNPAVNWISKKLSSPFFMEFEIISKIEITNGKLFTELVLMLLNISKLELKKVRPLFFRNEEKQYRFNNIRFEFADSSVITLKILKSTSEEKYTIKTISNQEIISSDLLKPSVDSSTGYSSLKSFKFTNEFESFFRSIRKNQPPKTGLNDYFKAKKVVDEIINNVSHPTT